MTTRRLKADATNRSLRTFLQGLGFAVLTAAVLVLYPVFTDGRSLEDVDWKLLGFSLIQVAGTAVLSYVMRTVLDKSAFPTPLPPADPGEPDDAAPEAGAVGLITIVVVIAVVLVLLLVLGAGR